MPVGKLRFNAQVDVARTTAGGVDSDRHKDYALGLGYAFRPALVAKVETHWTRTQVLDNRPVQFGGPGAKVNYTLLSLSVSF